MNIHRYIYIVRERLLCDDFSATALGGAVYDDFSAT